MLHLFRIIIFSSDDLEIVSIEKAILHIQINQQVSIVIYIVCFNDGYIIGINSPR